jgi:hypothetical protein
MSSPGAWRGNGRRWLVGEPPRSAGELRRSSYWLVAAGALAVLAFKLAGVA